MILQSSITLYYQAKMLYHVSCTLAVLLYGYKINIFFQILVYFPVAFICRYKYIIILLDCNNTNCHIVRNNSDNALCHNLIMLSFISNTA